MRVQVPPEVHLKAQEFIFLGFFYAINFIFTTINLIVNDTMLLKYTILSLLLSSSLTFAQEVNKSSDELFLEARDKAFEEKNYKEAINLANQALSQSPTYSDIAIFLGRLYTWSDETQLARETFKNVETLMDPSEDLYIAYTSLEYWNDDNDEALSIVDRGLIKFPKSEDLLLLKAKILNSDKNYKEASVTINELLRLNNSNTEARELATRIEINSAKNAIGISYNYSHFDKQFANDWNAVSVSYKRNTSLGSVILKLNYANKFKDNGTQVELEAYPRISKTFYMYVGGGYSNNVGIFPKYRGGASLYANLPKSFEADLGLRYLYFSDNLFMFTGSVGKYYKSFWFNLRTYITPSDKTVSQSYTFTTRYYTGDANNYFSFAIGKGISPEDFNNNLLGETRYKLKSFKLGLDYNFSIKEINLISVGANYFNQEYLPHTKGNQYDFSISYSRKF